MKTKPLNNIVFLILFIFSVIQVTGQNHIVLNAFDVNIRTGPGMEFYVVSKANKGEIFEKASEQGDWVEIKMFSPDNRFIHRDKVYFLGEFIDGHNMILPDKQKIKAIQQAARWAKTKARNEADEIIPGPISQEKHDNFKHICLDKNIHELMQYQNTQPALFFEILKHRENNTNQ